MPELPEVSPGEIIASDHINDIAGRTLQRYENQATLDLENPTPTEGELAYLEIGDTGLQQVLVYDGNDWVPIAIEFNGQFLPLAGGTGSRMAGDLYVGDSASTDEVRLLVQRSVAGTARTLRMSNSNVAATEGFGTLVHQSGATNDMILFMGDGEARFKGTTSTMRFELERDGAGARWRWAIGASGSLLLQYTTTASGNTWLTKETWTNSGGT